MLGRSCLERPGLLATPRGSSCLVLPGNSTSVRPYLRATLRGYSHLVLPGKDFNVQGDDCLSDDLECFERVCEVAFEIISEEKWREETLSDSVFG
ncbi:hypothetical protein NDU88_001506 [Pleurodeles waltl]|uniref:Uncharacterized protein n=1 Tax=Pleurodeles waltl TaxID=8319 RepID=A0AAV7KS65_PLEWA|nr:hypothetical protein NDU88_001506 [Pleurodeles waltl]